MESLQNTIETLKAGRTLAQLKREDKKTYYKVKGLSSKLSEQRAFDKGNFITKDDLVEYKGLIIWMMNNKANYRGYLNLKAAMQSLLNTVENDKIVYKTKRGIKSIVANLAIHAGLDNVESNLREANGIDILENSLKYRILEDFTQHRLNALMNN